MDEILKVIKDRLNQYSPVEVDRILLFGSRVNGTAQIDSDYDILIILSKTASWQERDEIRNLMGDVSIDNNILINSHFISLPELNGLRGKQPYIQQAMEQSIAL
jgi:predicted nucleotidyltransferase